MPRGRPQIYPWDEWLDGREHVLRAGRDFQVTATSMQKQIANEARRRELGTKTHVDGGSVVRILAVEDSRRRAFYRWDDWFDGEVHILIEGVHFHVNHVIMAACARRAAKNRGLRLQTRTRKMDGRRHLAIKAGPATMTQPPRSDETPGGPQ